VLGVGHQAEWQLAFGGAGARDVLFFDDEARAVRESGRGAWLESCDIGGELHILGRTAA